MKSVRTDKAPLPGGHYSQAMIHHDLVFVSGQLPIVPGTGEKLAGEAIDVQARQAIANMEEVLLAAGSSLDRVLKCTIFISDMSFWPEVNRVYAECFGTHQPARSVVPVKDLHYGLSIEIECVALI